MTDPEISVVIVNWNARDLLRDCLEALSASVGVTAEVIVVDNGSNDGSSELLRERFLRCVRF